MKKKAINPGILVISLDFELFWGVRDKRTLNEYGDSIVKVKQVIPRLLDVFDQYNIRATFATVGFLFAENKKHLIQNCPNLKPNYVESKLSPYENNFEEVGENEHLDPYHFALSLIKMVNDDSKHEIGSHTFSHYYCLEDGQTVNDFKADIEAAINIAVPHGIQITSLVVPRNQYNKEYESVLKELKIKTFRGNERIWFHSYQSEKETTLLKRMFRTANCYLNISGHHCYALAELGKKDVPYDIPSSRFLRPFHSKYPILRKLQLNRIKDSMTYAAKNNLLYHLWWHPHNFGKDIEENFAILEDVLSHFSKLQSEYGMKSHSMGDVGVILDDMRKEKQDL